METISANILYPIQSKNSSSLYSATMDGSHSPIEGSPSMDHPSPISETPLISPTTRSKSMANRTRLFRLPNMSAVSIPPFEATAVESIPSTVNLCKTTFRSQKTKPIEWRLQQLRKLWWGMDENADALIEACKKDLGKSAFEAYISEVDWCKNDIIFVTKNLAKWMKDEPAPDIPLTNSLLKPKIRKDPLGTVLIIGAYNFPIQLTFGPLIGAISAGCTAVLKPSELASATAMVMKNIVDNYLDTSAYAVINGAVAETSALLNEKWDKIFYTGGTVVGTIIAKKAAETLTPVTLELGGRNPAFITKNADPRLAARRMLWGKIHNAGQVCISQNYIMVEKEILPAFIEQLQIAMKEFFPKGQKASPDFSRIINNRHFHRIKKMLDDTKGRIIIGGEMDESENFIELTVVLVDDASDSMIVDESFGPLMPILGVNDIEEAIKTANSVDSTPLALYAFGSKAETSKVLNEVASGGASLNDAFFHASIPTMPFGGVGTSGQGSYRGKSSFDTFTHRRSMTTTPGWMEKMLGVRYPPYSDAKLKQFRQMSRKKPNFDRDGRETKGISYWLSFLGALGSEGPSGALVRWAVVIVVALGVKRYVDTGLLPPLADLMFWKK
ncbi:Aldehyde/histidinol dehydrogenase [Amylocarpus encephaloides]|uniref:Beta-apo-4'-carotenal oxygenase n=1 Tax=Amylocarpus encephaloides TaxID=45428 RepID=A0A9P7YRX3_9HELO|nr:Aldehyde/histidinol dehydrogenase [Amylocarpus encephaloides]